MLDNLDCIIEDLLKAAWANPTLRDAMIKHIKSQNMELPDNWEELLPSTSGQNELPSAIKDLLIKTNQFKTDLLTLLTTTTRTKD